MISCSVIIVAYNGMQYLDGCLSSLQAQGLDGCEVILVDNASTDGSGAFVQERFPWVRLARNQENAGFAAASNQGARLARGEYLAFLNQDTRVFPGWLDGLLAPFSHSPSIGLVTSKLLFMAAPGKINICGQVIHFSGLSFARGLLQNAEAFDQPGPVAAVSGASFAIRRDLWERLGGFDEWLFMYYEDTDLSWRAWLSGYASIYAPRSVAYHDGRLRPSANAVYYSTRNRCVLLLKNWRVRSLLLLWPGLLLADIFEWGALLLIGRQAARAKLRAARWVLANLFDLARAGRAARRSCPKPDWTYLAQCSPALTPAVITGGVAVRPLLFLANALLWINYRAALFLMRLLNI